MLRGLKQHTHQERDRVVEALIPLIQQHLGDNLAALALTGSQARGTDGPYSDIEILCFVKKRLEGDERWSRFVNDGMLIDLWYITREEYLDVYKEKVRGEWPYVAAALLVPLLNEPYVRALIDAPSAATTDRWLSALKAQWPLVQEAAAKFLNAVERDDADALMFLYWQMMEKLCVVLAFLNGHSFTTRAAVFTETRGFRELPPHFEKLLIRPDAPVKAEQLRRLTLTVFEEVEEMLFARGLSLYAKGLDSFVSRETPADRLKRRLKIDRVLRKMKNFAKAAANENTD
jgi:kanamycin nucleotidyltransferase